MNTLLLDRTTWDLLADATGNIAMASEPYSIAQDVACAVKLFVNELLFDKTKGIPYFEQVLGQRPAMQFIKAQIEKAALSVPEVVKARCMLAGFVNRKLTGQIQIIDQSGQEHNVQF